MSKDIGEVTGHNEKKLPDQEYLMGSNDAELERLTLLGTHLEPITRRLIRDSGISLGMRVLDIGCGMGDVSMLLAEAVGAAGHVVAIDREERTIAAASARARQSGYDRIEFVRATDEEMSVVYQLAAGNSCHALGAHTLKGLAAPLQVYRILAESAAQSRLDVASATGLTPLVGRDAEVALLLERWAQSQEGAGQVILLHGEAGIGKSRLVEVLRERVLSEGATRMVFHCSPDHQHSALYPVIDHLQRFLQWQRNEPPEAKFDTLERALLAYRLPLDDVVPLMAALLSIPLPAQTWPKHPFCWCGIKRLYPVCMLSISNQAI